MSIRRIDWSRDAQTYHLELVNDTDEAILVMTDHGKEVWLPRSWLIEYKDNQDGTCEFVLSDQHANEKEIA